MSRHTSGPWKAIAKLSGSENHKGYLISSDVLNGYALASVQPFDEDGIEGGANARLIATAPDLLEAARLTMAAVDDEYRLTGESDDYIYDTIGSSLSAAYFSARAAIAKATKG